VPYFPPSLDNFEQSKDFLILMVSGREWLVLLVSVSCLAVVPDFAQTPRHGSFYSLARDSPGPGLGLRDVDVDGVAVLGLFVARGEHSQPGHGGLLL